MHALTYTLGVVVFVLGVAVSIALHECGHMIPAKKFGVKVPQFFVGFGRTVWSFKRGETEYGLKAFPLGGFVKLVGMLPPEPGRDGSELRTADTGLFTQLISDARHAEHEHIGPQDQGRLFYQKPWWQKVIVMAGGPTVNLVIATVLFSISFIGFGVQTPTTTISAVQDCAIASSQAGRTCTAKDPVTPARKAGLQVGDTLVSFNGTPVKDWDRLTTLIRANGDRVATIGYTRDGEHRTVQIATTVLARTSTSDPDKTVKVGFLGVSPTTQNQRQGVGYVASQMGTMIKQTFSSLWHLPARMVDVVKAAFGAKRSADTPVSVVGASRVAGELVTADHPSFAEGAQRLITLIAGLNLFLWAFNLIPLLPLDGGHIAGALWEALRRALARLLRRPDPGYVDVAKMLPVAYAMGTVLMIMGVLLIFADIVNPVSLT